MWLFTDEEKGLGINSYSSMQRKYFKPSLKSREKTKSVANHIELRMRSGESNFNAEKFVTVMIEVVWYQIKSKIICKIQVACSGCKVIVAKLRNMDGLR